MYWRILFCVRLALMTAMLCEQARADEPNLIAPIQSLHNNLVGDQDDLCFWIHPSDASLSLAIVSDKKANRVFTYDLAGKLQQTIELTKPGNIDIRQGIRLGGNNVDLVAVNSRGEVPSLRVFSMDSSSRLLIAIDGSGIPTRKNYGGCLGYDKQQERLWFFCTSETVGVTQYELTMNAARTISGKEVRRWDLGKCEGAVGDDEAQQVFVTVETEGVWCVGMSPDSGTPGQKILAIGQHGMQADLEGITLASLSSGTPVLIVSSQSINQFFVFERSSPWKHCGTFRIEGASDTDGIDLVQIEGLARFGGGIFGCHTSAVNHPVLLSAWDAIQKSFLPVTK